MFIIRLKATMEYIWRGQNLQYDFKVSIKNTDSYGSITLI